MARARNSVETLQKILTGRVYRVHQRYIQTTTDRRQTDLRRHIPERNDRVVTFG